MCTSLLAGFIDLLPHIQEENELLNCWPRYAAGRVTMPEMLERLPNRTASALSSHIYVMRHNTRAASEVAYRCVLTFELADAEELASTLWRWLRPASSLAQQVLLSLPPNAYCNINAAAAASPSSISMSSFQVVSVVTDMHTAAPFWKLLTSHPISSQWFDDPKPAW